MCSIPISQVIVFPIVSCSRSLSHFYPLSLLLEHSPPLSLCFDPPLPLSPPSLPPSLPPSPPHPIYVFLFTFVITGINLAIASGIPCFFLNRFASLSPNTALGSMVLYWSKALASCFMFMPGSRGVSAGPSKTMIMGASMDFMPL